MKIANDLLGKKEMSLSAHHFFIPQKFAESINELEDSRLFATIGDRRILIFPIDAWGEYVDRLDKFRDPRLKKQIHRQEMFGTIPSKLDKSNRLKISAMHYEFLNESDKVKVVGARDHLQVFTIENFNIIFAETQQDKQAIIAEEEMGYAPVSHTSIDE